ncbi:hypothetical protein LCM02_08820 [Lutimonas saemankumensis]|uniref:hypothetical protein n=1 Tax=Lutimonas saemankumensis TaxID=483016 RepID=UPI001CD743E1|nr:hypothetical protein [Lutimonas saemankumensis]MCA0932553.1 hypothetical protein [Lutimonas saemankumensis]
MMKLLFSFLAFFVIYCDDSDAITKQEIEKEKIDNLKSQIKTLADTSVCTGDYRCYSVGIGAKPCGGFWEYIVYSNSIDVVDFLAKIEELNKLEKAYNLKYSIQSDCFLAMPPSRIECIDGKCTGVFEN